jgi:hypothetical protein
MAFNTLPGIATARWKQRKILQKGGLRAAHPSQFAM